jgi:hypothetical protein
MIENGLRMKVKQIAHLNVDVPKLKGGSQNVDHMPWR